MSVWFAVPVAQTDIDRSRITFDAWKGMGYRIAALVNGERLPYGCDIVLGVEKYCGWAWAVNRLARMLVDFDFVVTGGADVFPDPTKAADAIASECVEYFGGTYGVMQPAGDKYGAIESRTACVSPWLGREWCQRAYGGTGPLHGGYYHFYADGDLMHTAKRLDRLWWREDLTQRHDHWLRRGDEQPAHLTAAAAANDSDKALFEARKAAGWPDQL